MYRSMTDTKRKAPEQRDDADAQDCTRTRATSSNHNDEIDRALRRDTCDIRAEAVLTFLDLKNQAYRLATEDQVFKHVPYMKNVRRQRAQLLNYQVLQEYQNIKDLFIQTMDRVDRANPLQRARYARNKVRQEPVVSVEMPSEDTVQIGNNVLALHGNYVPIALRSDVSESTAPRDIPLVTAESATPWAANRQPAISDDTADVTLRELDRTHLYVLESITIIRQQSITPWPVDKLVP